MSLTTRRNEGRRVSYIRRIYGGSFILWLISGAAKPPPDLLYYLLPANLWIMESSQERFPDSRLSILSTHPRTGSRSLMGFVVQRTANGLHELLGNYKTEAKLLKLKKLLPCVYRRRIEELVSRVIYASLNLTSAVLQESIFMCTRNTSDQR